MDILYQSNRFFRKPRLRKQSGDSLVSLIIHRTTGELASRPIVCCGEMKVVAYSSSGVPIDTLSNISAAPPQVAVRAETRQSCFDSNSAVSSDDFSVIHMRLLRCIGTLCIIFGTIEIGLGGSLFVFFSNVRAGAWWSVVLVVIAGIFSQLFILLSYFPLYSI